MFVKFFIFAAVIGTLGAVNEGVVDTDSLKKAWNERTPVTQEYYEQTYND